jgi:hypothetical protein
MARDIEAAETRLESLVRDAAGLTDRERARERSRERYLREAAALDKLLQEYAFAVPVRGLERGRLPPHIAAARFDKACDNRARGPCRS